MKTARTPGIEKTDRLEKYLDRMLAKCESAKADLERNWMLQITSIAASIALLAGLGNELALQFFGTSRTDLLFIALPLVNTYLFVRFGSLANLFSKARYNVELLTNEVLPPEALPAGVNRRIFFETNSQFEYVHHPFSVTKFLFSLTIPCIFALNHTTTILSLREATGGGWWFALVVAVYAAIAGTCYATYYIANRANTGMAVGGERTFLIAVAVASLLLTFLFVGLSWDLVAVA